MSEAYLDLLIRIQLWKSTRVKNSIQQTQTNFNPKTKSRPV